MPTFTWVADVPAGVLRNHALSNRILRAAIAEVVLMPFTKPVDGFGRRRGETVSWTRVSNITEQASIVLSETERVPEHQVAITVRGSTVQEIGAAVPYTNLATELTAFDLESELQGRLRDNLALGLDTLVSLAMKDTQHKWAITGLTTNAVTTNGVFGAVSIGNVTTSQLEQMADYLYDTLLCPYYANEMYIGIFRQAAIRGIMNDPDWAEWNKYTNPTAKYKGEAGEWDRVKVVKTNHAAAFGKVGTGGVLGEGVVFGRDPVRMAEAMAPELLANIPQDLGRSKTVGYYGILRFTSTWGDRSNAGEANSIHVGSL